MALKHELKLLLRLSGPILLGQISQTLMGLADTLMAGRVSSVDLAAVSIGAGLWIPLMLAIGGLLMALTPLVATHQGAQQIKQIAPWLQQGIGLALILGLVASYVLQHTQPLLQLLQVSAELQRPTLAYLNAIAWGMPALALFQVCRACADGLSHPKAGMWISLLGLLANIPLNAVFIYGYLGFAPRGGPGCGLASAIAFGLMAVLMLVYLWRSPYFAEFDLYQGQWLPEFGRLAQLLKVGLPIACSVFVEVSLFTIISLLLARLGAQAVAAHQIALSISSLIFMLPLSIGLALCIRIGFLLGQEQRQQLALACRVALMVALLQAVVACVLTCYFAPTIAAQYSQDPKVVGLAIQLLYLAAIYQIPDALQVVAAGALRGFRDTLVAFAISFIAFWCIGMSLGYSLALTSIWGHVWGPRGMWMGIIVGLTVAAVLFATRLTWRLRQVQRLCL